MLCSFCIIKIAYYLKKGDDGVLQLFRKKQQFLAVSYATILHCLVDFCCIYLMMYFVFPACRFTSLSNWLLYTMLYNFIAFAGQLPVGIFGIGYSEI